MNTQYTLPNINEVQETHSFLNSYTLLGTTLLCAVFPPTLTFACPCCGGLLHTSIWSVGRMFSRVVQKRNCPWLQDSFDSFWIHEDSDIGTVWVLMVLIHTVFIGPGSYWFLVSIPKWQKKKKRDQRFRSGCLSQILPFNETLKSRAYNSKSNRNYLLIFK